MALFTDRLGGHYAPNHMPRAKRGNGPWGEAIEYWLRVKKISQADLVRATDVRANTISRVTRGFHTMTSVLEKIANALDVPLDAVLVSPERKMKNEERRQLVADITERVVRTIEGERVQMSGIEAAKQEIAELEQIANKKTVKTSTPQIKSAQKKNQK